MRVISADRYKALITTACGGLVTALASLALSSAQAQLVLPTAPRSTTTPASVIPFSGPLMDCSLHRYGSQLDEVVASTLKGIGGGLASSAELQAAAKTRLRTDVTEVLHREGLLQRGGDCTKPAVRAFMQAGELQIELAFLQPEVCLRLQASPALRAGGFAVTPLHVPSGEARCGMARNPIPKALVLGRLTQAGRMLPGDNTVVIAMPVTAASAQTLARPKACRAEDGYRDSMVEDIVANRVMFDTTDYPRNWPGAGCGAMRLGVCTTREWERYHERLLREFESMIDKAKASRDPLRVYSNARWIIEKSDPTKYTIRSGDYRGRECDVIRDRLVPALISACAPIHLSGTAVIPWFDVLNALKNARGVGKTLRTVTVKFIKSGRPLDCALKIGDEYKTVDELFNRFARPTPFPEYRATFLDSIGNVVQGAMQTMGYGSCSYYAAAVDRLDYQVWKDEYENGLFMAPTDWEHDFMESAEKCVFGR